VNRGFAGRDAVMMGEDVLHIRDSYAVWHGLRLACCCGSISGGETQDIPHILHPQANN